MHDPDKKAVVFGTPNTRVVFLPRQTAEWLGDVNSALGAPTWGELRREMAAIGEDVSADR